MHKSGGSGEKHPKIYLTEISLIPNPRFTDPWMPWESPDPKRVCPDDLESI